MSGKLPSTAGVSRLKRAVSSVDAIENDRAVSRQIAWFRKTLPLVSWVILLQFPSVVYAASTPDASNAFALPSSDLVFRVTATAPVRAPGRNEVAEKAGVPGKKPTMVLPRRISLEAREGTLFVIYPATGDTARRMGLVITRDKTGDLAGTAGTTFVVHRYLIESDPAGGERMEILYPLKEASYGETVDISGGGIEYSITVEEDWLGTFDDLNFLDDVKSALRRDSNSLSGLYELVYSLYGPSASGCVYCDGVWVCGTNVTGCGGGAWSF